MGLKVLGRGGESDSIADAGFVAIWQYTNFFCFY